MKIWLITDTHFGHSKMEEYCNRPSNFEFKIQKGLQQITKNDILIHLGDICIGDDNKWHELMIRYLPCKKWLTIGNHDNKSYSWYLEHGWDMVSKLFVIDFQGKTIAFSHEPVKDFGFDFNIHGHFHNNLHRLQQGEYVIEGEKERNEEVLSILTPKHKCLAIENTNYQPISLDNFLAPLIK